MAAGTIGVWICFPIAKDGQLQTFFRFTITLNCNYGILLDYDIMY